MVVHDSHMPSLRRVAVVLLASGLAALGPPRHGCAQAPRRAVVSADSARLVADLFFRAIADEKWEAAASLVDTTAVRRLVTQRLRERRQFPAREMTIDDFMRDDPKKPLTVAEYELKRYREQMASIDASNAFSFEFLGIRSAEELRALSTLQATVRFLQAKDMRMQMREYLRRSGCADSTFRMPFSVHRIIATALANDSVAYVLHQDGMFTPVRDAEYPIDPFVMQLRLRGGRWLIVPTPTLMSGNGMGFATVGGATCDSTSHRRPD